MTDPRLDPPRSMPTYAVRAPLVRWLAEEAARAHRDLGPYRVLDVGCGEKPYAPLFAPFAASYVGVDPVDNPHAEVEGYAEELPLPDACADVVLCIQVLEHVDDPAAVVSRARARDRARWTRAALDPRRDGVPPDRRSTTGAGRTRASSGSSRRAATWASVRVTPASGTTACLGMLTSLYLDLRPARAHAPAGSRGRSSPRSTQGRRRSTGASRRFTDPRSRGRCSRTTTSSRSSPA